MKRATAPAPTEQALSPANCFDLPRFVLTSPVQRAKDLCQVLQQTRTLGMLIGLPGVGKTWAVQYAAQNQPQPEMITASPVIYTTADVGNTPATLLTNLITCLGPDYRAPVPELTRWVCCWIHRREVALIIIDDAERLDKTSWEICQDIHDRTRCAFLFVGSPDLLRKLRARPALLNRVSLTVELPLLTFDELVNFVLQRQEVSEERRTRRSKAKLWLTPDHEPGDITIIKEIYRVTFGNLRRVCQLIDEVERVAALNGHSYVELPVVEAAARLMSGETR
jgi:DNA transposition AAA+ family ATPase